MPTQAQRQEQITKIERLPAQLEALVAGLNDEQLDTPYGEGKWTIRQVIHHLADSHTVALVRVRLMLTEDHPTLIVYQQDRWAELPDAATMPIAVSLNLLHGLHARWSFLLNGLDDAAWTRTAHHPERGSITMDDMLKIYSGHGEGHMKSIRDLRESRGW